MEKTDKVVDEILEDKASDERSDDTEKEPITAERAFELARGLQKGYTQTRQDIADIKANLEQIVATQNAKSGAQEGDNEYLTVAKAREIITGALDAQRESQIANSRKADEIIETGLNALRADGVIKSKADEQELIQYAVDIGETDLSKASKGWQKYKSAKDEGTKEAAKKGVKQEEGSKVGTSSKTTAEGEQGKGVDIHTIRRTGWYNF